VAHSQRAPERGRATQRRSAIALAAGRPGIARTQRRQRELERSMRCRAMPTQLRSLCAVQALLERQSRKPKGERVGPSEEGTAPTDSARRSLRRGRWFNVRAGNPAVLGTRALRPEALRPHLSVSLP